MDLLVSFLLLIGLNVVLPRSVGLETKFADSSFHVQKNSETTKLSETTTTTQYLPAPYCGWPDGTKNMIIFGGRTLVNITDVSQSPQLEIDHPCTTGGNQVYPNPFKSSNDVIVDSLLIPYQNWIIGAQLTCSKKPFCQKWRLEVERISSGSITNSSAVWETIFSKRFSGGYGSSIWTGLSPYYLNGSSLMINSLPINKPQGTCPPISKSSFAINLDTHFGSFVKVTGQTYMTPGSSLVPMDDRWYLLGGWVQNSVPMYQISGSSSSSSCYPNREIYVIDAKNASKPIGTLDKVPSNFQVQSATGGNGQLYYCGIETSQPSDLASTDNMDGISGSATCYRWDLMSKSSIGYVRLPAFHYARFGASLMLFDNGLLAVGGKDEAGGVMSSIEWLGTGGLGNWWMDVKPMTIGRAGASVLLVGSS